VPLDEIDDARMQLSQCAVQRPQTRV